MLVELRAENYAVIDHAIATFGSGLNLLTGETGAGKSILVDALALLMGGKASAEVVRHGADKAVVAIKAQPHRVEIPVPWQNRPLIYFPDLRRDLADGAVEIIETKREDDRRAREPHYQFKLDVVREVYAGEGWTFRTLQKQEILGGHLYRNAHEISTWAYAKVPSASQFALEAAIDAAGGSLPFGKAAESAGGAPLLYALVVRRSVYFDLTLPVSDDLPVMRVDHDALRRHSPPLL